MPKKSSETVAEVKDSPGKTKQENRPPDSDRLLGAVLEYLSDDEVEVIDIEYLLENTEGLREWWEGYRELNRQRIEKEIKESLGKLSLEDLEMIRQKIKGKEPSS
ncbi:hypothetical protein [Bacillus sp. REN3]|uniref:hypothetical protein n=1 Tax=Bacillus sp. REN3 TaxID=2802440 RepID=UPI001AEE46B5|nr:hypothetical protein [Bacillus sp. REN3]